MSIQGVQMIVLWLFVINLGIAFGAGLYESRIVVPQWSAVRLEAVTAGAALMVLSLA